MKANSPVSYNLEQRWDKTPEEDFRKNHTLDYTYDAHKKGGKRESENKST